MKVYLDLREHGDACRKVRAAGGATRFRTIDAGICPAIGYKDTSPTHCVHTFPDTTKVCCGCEKVFRSKVEARAIEIRFELLEAEGLI